MRRIGASPEIDSGVEVRNASSLEVWPSAALKYFHGIFNQLPYGQKYIPILKVSIFSFESKI